jgi:crotonobetaine/carnitine-CoA ligase
MVEVSADDPAPRTVGAVLERAARSWPNETAVVIDGLRLTYQDVIERAEATRQVLAGLGIGAGDRLLVMLDNVVEFVDVFAATGSAGIVQVPVNTEYRGQLLRHAIELSGARVMVADAGFLSRLADVLPFTTLEQVVIVGELVGAVPAGLRVTPLADLLEHRVAESTEPPSPVDVDPIAIMYTSGTTGPSKGVLVSQRHAYEYASTAARSIELAPGDVYYAPLPLFHIAGQWAMLYASWITGATAVIKRKFSVHDFWADVRENGATVSFLLGAMAQFLSSLPDAADDGVNPMERVLMVPLVADLKGFRDRFAVRVTTCYGSTDVNVPVMAGFDVEDPTVAGRVIDGFQVRLVDEFDNDVPDGAVGELVVRPPEPWMTMIEYVGDPVATAEAFRNLWLHSGDMFRRGVTGELHFVDRLKDSIRRRGENISSYEVEAEVNAHPAIAESAAIAVPSQNTEDDLGVVVVPRQGAHIDERELREFIAARAPRFMVPDVIWVIDAMPKTPTGKIQKNELRTRFSAERDHQAAERKRATDTG